MGNVAFMVYRVAIYLMVPLILFRYLARASIQRGYFQSFTQRFGFAPKRIEHGAIWVHAVSVGEVNAAAPLIEALLQQRQRVLLTCVTPTGAAQARKSFGSAVDSCYAPIDAGIFVARFISWTQPAALIIMETEIWPNMIRLASNRQVPVFFANMRISDRTFRRAKRLRPLFSHVVQSVAMFNVQTDQDLDRVATLGVASSRIRVTGNLKFDTAAVASDVEQQGIDLRSRWGHERPAIVLGSSHKGEEAMMVAVFERLRIWHPDLVCVIVPRHPERFNAVYKSLAKTDYRTVRYTELHHAAANAEVDLVLADTMGDLMSFYCACDVAIVGGSFVDIGGHNILEPIATRRPVIFGPYMSNFKEVARLVAESGAGVQAAGREELCAAIRSYLDDETLRSQAAGCGMALIDANRGALQRTLDGLKLK